MDSFFSLFLARLASAFSWQTLSQKLAAGIFNLTIGLFVFSAFCLCWLLARWLLAASFRRTQGDETTAAFLQAVLKFLVLAIGALSALDAAGVETSTVLTSLGVVGITVGLAARDALSNLIAGVLIFIDRPFVIGDLVEIDGRYGRIERITLRSTRIVTPDGKMLAVPNNEIVNRTVASYTNFPNLRLDIAINVGLQEDIETVRRILLDLVTDRAEFMPDPAPQVVTKSLNDYNLTLELQVWIYEERDHIDLRFKLREQMYEALKAAGIDMPLQTVQLAPVELVQKDN